MKKTFTLITLTLVLSFLSVNAQNTVGLLSADQTETLNGYNLMYPHNQSNVYLLNNCGEIAHVWEDSIYIPGNTAYLTEEGLLYRSISRGAASNSYINAGGAGEGFEIRDWDNNLIWQWFYNDSTHRPHHDFTILPNGNIVAVAWERISAAEAFANGRDTALLDNGELWPGHLIEVEPVGLNGGNIVWQWNAMDHLIQDYDSTKLNYGDPADHPELIDFNFGGGVNDWLHINAIDYNPNYDQLLISVPRFNEIWIIDHSTTTTQAAGHLGGFGGRGGDLHFRWGAPEAYRAGTEEDQQLFFQHDAHWVDIELTNNNPNYGKIMVFNNRYGANYSTVNIINPVFDSYELGFIMDGGTFLPNDFDWSYQRPDSTEMFSGGLSSVQRLMNGNTLICVGRTGYTFEINEEEDIVWEYKNPMSGGNPVTQGTSLAVSENQMFRMKRYSANYPAFIGKDLSAQGFIELDPNLNFCILGVSVEEFLNEEAGFRLFPNPGDQMLTLELEKPYSKTSLIIYEATGRIVYASHNIVQKEIKIDVSKWDEGVYIIRLDGIGVRKLLISH